MTTKAKVAATSKPPAKRGGATDAAPAQRAIPFTKPFVTGREVEYLRTVVESGKLTGGGKFLRACEEQLRIITGAENVLLTTSCTAALEISALLSGVGPGDEVIMPAFTFVSTANAFALRGTVPVFVDNREDTLDIDETKIEAAITPRTKAIVPVHYAGMSCDMDAIFDIAERHKLMVIEDAAQGLCASYKGRPLGTIGALGTFSFHETKNIVAGEGGALVVNDPKLLDRALTIREKGTNRRKFLLGAVDKYTWTDVGSAYLPSELMGAVLLAQLEAADRITDERHRIWNAYHEALAPLEHQNLLRRPTIPEKCRHNAHIYYALLPHNKRRNQVLAELNRCGIAASFHFVPLHSAPAGARLGRAAGLLTTTENTAGRLLRLPLYAGMSEADYNYVIEVFTHVVKTA